MSLFSRTARFVLPVLSLIAAAAAAQPVESFRPEGIGRHYAPGSNGTLTALPSIEAAYLAGAGIKVDGHLDDAAWNEAPTGWGFQQHEPDRGVPATVQTPFKICYDDEALYIGMACWEDDMANVSGTLSRRDQIESSDIVSIYLDPYFDRTTGYNFRVNPAGVQQDAYLFDNGNRDDDWDAVWQAEVSSDEHGWYVEMRIPFSAIRFTPTQNMTWGLQVYRWMHARGEDTGWVTWDRNLSGFVSRWGTLTGLRDVNNPRKLEITPYVVTSHTNPSTPDEALDGWDGLQNLGADVKYGLASNLTLNATFQPDFGQVEADPAVLNLSPFETWYEEKRPFFVEGARFFQHPHTNLFYSRRIGTGDANSRIRGAAKLTGKIGGDLSIAVLGAATDLAPDGRVHNPFAEGSQKTRYGLVRVGKEFADGNHSIAVMGTGVFRDEKSFTDVQDPRLRRDGLSSGADFEMNFGDRTWRVKGSWAGTRVMADDEAFSSYGTTEAVVGHATRLDLRKLGGDWRGGGGVNIETDRFDPNDMGFLSAPDEIVGYADLGWYYDSDGEDALFNRASLEIDGSVSSFWAAGSGHSVVEESGGALVFGDEAWSYDRRHRQSSTLRYAAWGQLHNYHQGSVMVSHHLSGSSKWATRRSPLGERGPLMDEPGWTNIEIEATTDWRKPISLNLEFEGYVGARYLGFEVEGSVRWNQNQHFSHWLGWSVERNVTDAQWLENFTTPASLAGASGIGGVDYVFAEMDRWTVDLTYRAAVLFDRNRSLQIYLQPFLTQGDHTDPRVLAEADSYDLRPYDLDASTYDFRIGSLNLNAVYRWEYRPGSTFYLAWSRSNYARDIRGGGAGGQYDRSRSYTTFAFDSEPHDTIMAKLSYWFSI